MSYKLTAACSCNMGKIRKNNEDNFYFDHKILPEENFGLDEVVYVKYDLAVKSGLFGVFDGMGGEADGQIASYLSAKILQENCDKLLSNSAKLKKSYEAIINQMNEAVYLDAERRFNRMGCTAAMLMFAEKKVYLCNVGDSPIFRLRNKALEQISLDHTDADMLKKQGITNRKPHLTQCIGISPEEMQIQPYLYEAKIEVGDRYLICSDGLTDMVSQNEIAKTMAEIQDVEDCAESLIQKALDGGGRDNITVVVIQVEDGEFSEKDTGRVRHGFALRNANEGHKDSDLQVSEQFKEALRRNDFLEENETKELTANVQKSDAGYNASTQKSKKSKLGMSIISVLVLLLGIGFFGKSMFHKDLGEEDVREIRKYEQQEDIGVDDIMPESPVFSLDEEETEEENETPEVSGELEEATEESEDSAMPEIVEISIDLDGDGIEDVLETFIINEEGGSIVYVSAKIGEIVSELKTIPCTYEMTAENIIVSAGELVEGQYSVVMQFVDANSNYGSTEYHVFNISAQEGKLMLTEEILTMLDKSWEDEQYQNIDILGFGALQSVPGDEVITYIESIGKNAIKVKQARTAEENQLNNEVYVYWNETNWEVHGSEAYKTCLKLYGDWTEEQANELNDKFQDLSVEDVGE